MKTFFDLIQDVQNPGMCHHCGGCVSFCTAVNYGALEAGPDGRPRYKDKEKCIECGLCWSICPEISELDQEMKRRSAWSIPMGRIIEATAARAKDPAIREKATDGGVVTALLTHLMEAGRIDGAIVSQPAGAFIRKPCLAVTQDEIIGAAGFNFNTSQGVASYGDTYSTYSPSVHGLGPLARKGLHRVAFVGTPCQIKALRKMQVMGIVPSDAIQYCLGLFCTGNFTFGDAERDQLETLGGFTWDQVKKVNVKEHLLVHLHSGERKKIRLDDLDFMKRHACRFCDDYTAEYADISFGGIGVDEGWTNILTRTPVGRAVFADARETVLEEMTHDTHPGFATRAMDAAAKWSSLKKAAAASHRSRLGRSEKPIE
jgi:coenzyme F420 hydrogenase subunit beta